MDKRKLRGILSGVGLLVVVGLIVFAGYKIYHNKHTQKASVTAGKAVPSKVKTKEELAEAGARITNFNDILDAYKAHDLPKTLELAQAYAKDTKNHYTERLNAYVMCINAATDSKNDVVKKSCYDAAKTLASTLTVASEKTGWKTTLDNTYNGLSPAETADDRH